jgi:hypothetical protein
MYAITFTKIERPTIFMPLGLPWIIQTRPRSSCQFREISVPEIGEIR